MILKYNVEINNNIIDNHLKKIINQVYKLLPIREEGIDWKKPLETLVEELVGMNFLLIGYQEIFFPLLCKLEGLFDLTEEDDFLLYRRTIFECISLIEMMRRKCQE